MQMPNKSYGRFHLCCFMTALLLSVVSPGALGTDSGLQELKAFVEEASSRVFARIDAQEHSLLGIAHAEDLNEYDLAFGQVFFVLVNDNHEVLGAVTARLGSDYVPVFQSMRYVAIAAENAETYLKQLVIADLEAGTLGCYSTPAKHIAYLCARSGNAYYSTEHFAHPVHRVNLSTGSVHQYPESDRRFSDVGFWMRGNRIFVDPVGTTAEAYEVRPDSLFPASEVELHRGDRAGFRLDDRSVELCVELREAPGEALTTVDLRPAGTRRCGGE